jgi:transposase
VVEATFAPGASIARIAREHGLNANLLFNWRYQFRLGRLGPALSAPALLPVELIPDVPAMLTSPPLFQPEGCMELTLSKGQLRIQGRPDADTLRLVLQVLTT